MRVCGSLVCTGGMADTLTDELRELVERERTRFGVPGCAVAVVRDGEVVLAEGFGHRDIDKQLPVTAGTLFPIGSSTKTFTAALCATLVRDGLLEWGRPVRDYLPDFRMVDPAATEQLNIRDMLGHRSGLPRHDLLWYAAGPDRTRDELIEALRHLEPNHGFREVWQYNNLLYTTAGVLAGRLHGSGYEDAVRDRLLHPLGMKRTNFSVSEAQQDADCSRPYFVSPGGSEPREIPFATLDLVGPAGNINSSIDELIPWVLTLLGHGVNGQEPLLSEALLRELRTPVIPLPEDSPLAVGRSVGYCLGLLLEDYRGHRVTHHGGNIDGFSSQVSTLVEAGCAVVVLTNRDQTGLRDALPYVIYDHLLGLSPLPHGETIFEKEEALRHGAEQAQEHQQSSKRPDLPAVRPVTEYVGRYRHPGYGEFSVSADGAGNLRGEYGTVSGHVEHRHLEVFDFVVELGGVERRLPVQFTSDLAGDVDGANVPLEPTVKPIRFELVPDTSHLTDELLDSLAGTYALGPVIARVQRRGDKELVLSIADMEGKPLKPIRGRIFAVEGQRLEFGADGRVFTPFGEFVKQ